MSKDFYYILIVIGICLSAMLAALRNLGTFNPPVIVVLIPIFVSIIPLIIIEIYEEVVKNDDDDDKRD